MMIEMAVGPVPSPDELVKIGYSSALDLVAMTVSTSSIVTLPPPSYGTYR